MSALIQLATAPADKKLRLEKGDRRSRVVDAAALGLLGSATGGIVGAATGTAAKPKRNKFDLFKKFRPGSSGDHEPATAGAGWLSKRHAYDDMLGGSEWKTAADDDIRHVSHDAFTKGPITDTEKKARAALTKQFRNTKKIVRHSAIGAAIGGTALALPALLKKPYAKGQGRESAGIKKGVATGGKIGLLAGTVVGAGSGNPATLITGAIGGGLVGGALGRRIGGAIGSRMKKKDAMTTNRMSALTRLIRLKALDLGYSYDSYDSPCATPTKINYPCLYVSDRPNDIDLPLTGTAKVKFKLRSKTSRQDGDGKTRHSADIEIQSIDPIKDEDAPLKEGEKARLLSSIDNIDDLIQFVIQFNKLDKLGSERVGQGFQTALAKILKMYPKTPKGAGVVVKRRHLPSKPLAPLPNKVKTFAALGERVINLIDPRPRNGLGEFTDNQEGGPSPNQIGTVYKSGPRIGENLAGGAAAGLGAAASGQALKSLLAKIRKTH